MDVSRSRITRGLVLAATLLDGLLAGGNVERNLVHMPAWRHVGAPAWAAFSRNADLRRNGMIVYPLAGIGGALCTIAAAIAYYSDRRALARFRSLLRRSWWPGACLPPLRPPRSCSVCDSSARIPLRSSGPSMGSHSGVRCGACARSWPLAPICGRSSPCAGRLPSPY